MRFYTTIDYFLLIFFDIVLLLSLDLVLFCSELSTLTLLKFEMIFSASFDVISLIDNLIFDFKSEIIFSSYKAPRKF